MSRSFKKVPIAGLTNAESDKPFKVQSHKRIRRRNKVLLQMFPDTDVFFHENELTNEWSSLKDGKRYYAVGLCSDEVREKIIRK